MSGKQTMAAAKGENAYGYPSGSNERLISKLIMSPEDKVLSQNYGQNYDAFLANIAGT